MKVLQAAAGTSHFGAAVRAFDKQVNAAAVDPKLIVKVRKKLALDRHPDLLSEIRAA